jgi:hypothetical protein
MVSGRGAIGTGIGSFCSPKAQLWRDFWEAF